jgi:hypothetical protein
MTEQLSLFPDKALNLPDTHQDENITGLAAALNPVDEIFASLPRFRNSNELMEMMQFISRFPNYSTFNGWLLYLQNSSATCVATARTWAQKYKRTPKPNAHPLVILAPMAPILFLFDIQDTEGPAVPPALLQHRQIDDQQLGKFYATTLHNAAIHGIAVFEIALNSAESDNVHRITPALRKKYKALNLPKDTSYLIFIDRTQSPEGRYASLVHELGHIFCSHLGIDRHAWWPERQDLNIRGEDIEAASVAYLVCQRIGLKADAEDYLLRFSGPHQKIPTFSMNAVIQAAAYIEDMGKHRWKTPKKRR